MGYPNLSRFDAQLCTMSVDGYFNNDDAMCTLKAKEPTVKYMKESGTWCSIRTIPPRSHLHQRG